MTGQVAFDWAPDPVADLGEALLRELGIGRGAARRSRELAHALGCSERVVRSMVETLRKEGHLIGSSSSASPGHPAGFYVITDLEELEATARHLRSRAIGMLQTVRAMARTAEDRFGSHGARLFALEEVS